MLVEALDEIVDSYRDDGGGGPADQEGAEGEHHIVQVILQCGTADAEFNGKNYGAEKPRRVQAVFGPPSAAVAAAEVEREAVVNQVTVELSEDAEPEAEGDFGGGAGLVSGSHEGREEGVGTLTCSILDRCKSVTALQARDLGGIL